MVSVNKRPELETGSRCLPWAGDLGGGECLLTATGLCFGGMRMF